MTGRRRQLPRPMSAERNTPCKPTRDLLTKADEKELVEAEGSQAGG